MRSTQIKATLALIFMVSSVTVSAQEGANSAQATEAKTEAKVSESGNSSNTNISTSEAKAEVAPVQAKSEVVIIQAPAPVAVQAVEQPTTVVSAAPLAPSEADELRKARERAEIETEQKIVEKLERSRLSDEQKRLNRLFKPLDEAEEKSDKKEAKAEAPAVAAAATIVTVEPAQTVGDNSQATQTIKIEAGTAAVAEPKAAAVTVAPEATATAPEAVAVAPVVAAPVVIEPVAQSSVKADLEDIKEEAKAEKKNRFSVGGVIGSMDYADAYNVSSDFGAGVTIGWENDTRFGVEAAFIYSQHLIDESYSLYKQVDQYNWSVAARYAFLPWKITPVVGAIVSYTRREYTDMYSWGYSSFSGRQSASSDAMDGGLLVGVDFEASSNLSLGLEYRYMTNLNSRYDDPESFNRTVYDTNNKYYQTLEDIDYDMIGFSMKFKF